MNDTPDINEIYCKLSTALSLVEIANTKYLQTDRGSIWNNETKSRLAGYTHAYDLCLYYGHIADLSSVVEDKMSEVLTMIERLQENEGKKAVLLNE